MDFMGAEVLQQSLERGCETKNDCSVCRKDCIAPDSQVPVEGTQRTPTRIIKSITHLIPRIIGDKGSHAWTFRRHLEDLKTIPLA